MDFSGNSYRHFKGLSITTVLVPIVLVLMLGIFATYSEMFVTMLFGVFVLVMLVPFVFKYLRRVSVSSEGLVLVPGISLFPITLSAIKSETKNGYVRGGKKGTQVFFTTDNLSEIRRAQPGEISWKSFFSLFVPREVDVMDEVKFCIDKNRAVLFAFKRPLERVSLSFPLQIVPNIINYGRLNRLFVSVSDPDSLVAYIRQVMNKQQAAYPPNQSP